MNETSLDTSFAGNDDRGRGPAEKNNADEQDAEEVNFCELCGCSEEDEQELVRCEECGRLVCANCREQDAEGTAYCIDCYDELTEE